MKMAGSPSAGLQRIAGSEAAHDSASSSHTQMAESIYHSGTEGIQGSLAVRLTSVFVFSLFFRAAKLLLSYSLNSFSR